MPSVELFGHEIRIHTVTATVIAGEEIREAHAWRENSGLVPLRVESLTIQDGKLVAVLDAEAVADWLRSRGKTP